MPNPFTAETRNARFSLGLEGLEKLRAPESLHRLVMLMKPGNLSATDFALTSMVNQVLMPMIVGGQYRQAYDTLGTLFGFEGPNGTHAPHDGPDGPLGPRRYAKAPGR